MRNKQTINKCIEYTIYQNRFPSGRLSLFVDICSRLCSPPPHPHSFVSPAPLHLRGLCHGAWVLVKWHELDSHSASYCVTLVKLHNLSKFSFPYQSRGNNNSVYLAGSLETKCGSQTLTQRKDPITSDYCGGGGSCLDSSLAFVSSASVRSNPHGAFLPDSPL